MRSIAELKGKQIPVNSLTTGSAFVFLEIMERSGLMLSRDHTTVAAQHSLLPIHIGLDSHLIVINFPENLLIQVFFDSRKYFYAPDQGRRSDDELHLAR